MAGTTEVARWWDMARYRYCERIGVYAKRYNELSQEERGKVYHYWSIGKVAIPEEVRR